MHEHDGLYLRLTTGPAGGAVSLDIPDMDEWTYRGGGWSSSIDIGGAPARDLVIFGRARGSWLLDPTLKVGGDKRATPDDLVVDQGMLGAGINYYVMPINIYLGGAIGFAWVERTRGDREEDEDDDGDVGFGIDLDAGKEWWIADNWGIGVALRLSLASVPASDIDPEAMFGCGSIAVLFSATYQ